MSDDRSVVGVVLAAGLSTRMGSPKPLLEWQGAPLVVYQVHQLLAGGCDRVLVVTGHESERVAAILAGSGATAVFNAEFRTGRASSVRAAAAAIDGEPSAIVLINVDQPRRAETIAQLLQAHREDDRLITVPSYEGKRGHPIVLSGRLLPELRQVDEQSEGLRAIVRRHDSAQRVLPVEMPDVLLDLNDRDAYDAARRRWGAGG